MSPIDDPLIPSLPRDAKLCLTSACVDDIDYLAHRELDRAQIRQLATCRWVVEHQNVLVTSATGDRSPRRSSKEPTDK